MSIENYGSFLTAILVFQLIPGPGTIAILNATARRGVPAGLSAVWGTLLGDFIYMVAAVVGLAAFIREYPSAFTTFQLLGGAYLAWMGIGMIRSAPKQPIAASSASGSPGAYFRQALFVGLTNPKVALFFLAFFPLFLTVDASASTLGVMMAHVTGISAVYQIALVFIGNALARLLARIKWIRVLAIRLSGVALIAFGIRLAANDR